MKTIIIYILLVVPIFFVDTNSFIEFNSDNLPIVCLFWGELLQIVIQVVISVALNYLFADNGSDEPGLKPGVVKIPRVTASEPVPVLFGTKIMSEMNVVWYGSVQSVPWEQCYG